MHLIKVENSTVIKICSQPNPEFSDYSVEPLFFLDKIQLLSAKKQQTMIWDVT